jgi:hypothetical protein
MINTIIGQKAISVEQQLKRATQKWQEDFKGFTERVKVEAQQDISENTSGYLGKWELKVRDGIMPLLRTILQDLVDLVGTGYQGTRYRHDDSWLEYKGLLEATIRTLLGGLTLKRAYYYNGAEKQSCFPVDDYLGIDGSKWSPGMKRVMSLVGSECPFERAGDLLSELAGIVVSDDSIQRIIQEVGPGIAAREKQERGERQLAHLGKLTGPQRLYMEVDGGRVPLRASWREVKLGCIFEGRPSASAELGDEKGVVRYFGGIYDELDEFINLWRQEAWAAGVRQAAQLIMLGDGAEWIWHRLAELFPQAIQILDYYHALEHAGLVALALYGEETAENKKWMEHIGEKLKGGKVQEVIQELEQLHRNNRKGRPLIKETINYYQNNAHRMEYDKYLAAGYFIGSGVIESACQHLSNQRLKIAGARWDKDYANNVLQIRIAWKNGTWRKYWEGHRKSA